MNLKLDNQLALVTACTGGIGLEIARALAGEGARVIINGRSASRVDAAIAAIRKDLPGAKLEKLATDNGTAEGAAETIRQFPQVDILVNNLGIDPAEIACVVTFVSSPLASAINGAALRVDGGLVRSVF